MTRPRPVAGDTRVLAARARLGTGLARLAESGRAALPYLAGPALLAIPVGMSLVLPGTGQLDVAILQLLVCVLVALAWGRGPALLTAICAIASFDYFFVAPLYSFRVSERHYVFIFAMMLGISAVVGEATALLRFRAREAGARERRARTLFELARELSVCETADAIVTAAARAIRRESGSGTLLLVDEAGVLQPGSEVLAEGEALEAARAALRMQVSMYGEAARIGSSPYLCIPVRTAQRNFGIIVLRAEGATPLRGLEPVEAFANLIGLALERVIHVNLAQAARHDAQAQEMRNTLLSALSHDLRAPLTSIGLLAESLAAARDALPPAQRSLAEELHESTQRMIEMTRKLLDIARVEGGAIQLRRDWFPLDEIVSSTISVHRVQLKAASLDVEFAEHLPLVFVDAALMERVLSNLIENALLHAGANVHIRIHAHASRSRLRLTVEDNGPGIPPARREAVFAKFVRDVHGRRGSGLGLGLAICNAIIAAHGGRIWIEESPCGGAAFCIELPRYAVPQSAPEPLPDEFSSDAEGRQG